MSAPSSSSPSSSSVHDIYFLHRFFEDRRSFSAFRLAELRAIAKLSGLTEEQFIIEPQDYHEFSPFLPARLICSPSVRDRFLSLLSQRSVLLRGVYQLWGKGRNIDECVEDTKQRAPALYGDYLSCSFNTSVHAFGFDYSVGHQEDARKKFHFLPFKGPVDLSDKAAVKYHIYFDHIGVNNPTHSALLVDSPDEKPIYGVYFFRELARCHAFYLKYALPSRKYIGPTSIPADLGFLFATQCLASPGKLIYDPFVGTGSLLINCSVFGAAVVGSDFDWRILHGRQRKAKYRIVDNFVQYGLPMPELLCADNSMALWRAGERFDAIVCDPPYGIRAGARKSGRKSVDGESADVSAAAVADSLSTVHVDDGHIPPSQLYDVEDVIDDLLDLAGRSLRTGGRLVYLLPSTADLRDDELPVHPLLRLVASSEQRVRKNFSRRLVTMEKARPWTGEADNKVRRIKEGEGAAPRPKYAELKAAILEGCEEFNDYVNKELAAEVEKQRKKIGNKQLQQGQGEAQGQAKEEDEDMKVEDEKHGDNNGPGSSAAAPAVAPATSTSSTSASSSVPTLLALMGDSKRSQKRVVRAAAKKKLIAQYKSGEIARPQNERRRPNPNSDKRAAAIAAVEAVGGGGQRKRRVIMIDGKRVEGQQQEQEVANKGQ